MPTRRNTRTRRREQTTRPSTTYLVGRSTRANGDPGNVGPDEAGQLLTEIAAADGAPVARGAINAARGRVQAGGRGAGDGPRTLHGEGGRPVRHSPVVKGVGVRKAQRSGYSIASFHIWKGRGRRGPSHDSNWAF